jgi:hypothetical protein
MRGGRLLRTLAAPCGLVSKAPVLLSMIVAQNCLSTHAGSSRLRTPGDKPTYVAAGASVSRCTHCQFTGLFAIRAHFCSAYLFVAVQA